METLPDGSFEVDEGAGTASLPSKPTAFATLTDGRFVVGGEDGRLCHVAVRRVGSLARVEVDAVRHGADWSAQISDFLTRQLGFRRSSPVFSITVDAEEDLFICLHDDSEIEVFAFDGDDSPRCVTQFHQPGVEVRSILRVPLPHHALCLLGLSADGVQHWFLSRPRRGFLSLNSESPTLELVTSNDSLSKALRRRRNEVVRVVGCAGGRLLLAFTDIDRETPATTLRWISPGAVRREVPDLVIEEIPTDIPGRFLGCFELETPAWSLDPCHALGSLEQSSDPLTQQLFRPEPRFVVLTDECLAFVDGHWPYRSLAKVLDERDTKDLGLFIRIHGAEETVASAIMLAMLDEGVGLSPTRAV